MATTDAFDFSGQVAIVTGGTRGLGKSVAEALADAGCAVTVCGRNTPQNMAENISFRQADVRDPDQAKALIDGVVADHGRIDIVVNNAGGSPHADAEAISPRFIDAVLKLNLVGPLYLAQAAHPHMAKARRGSIVNIASVSGARPSPGTAVYGAAKAGLLNLTQSLAQEWGSVGIRVNAIIAGLMITENAEATYGDAKAQAEVARSMPLQRMGTGEDLANAVLFLCSPQAEWMSGARIELDGGGEKPFFLSLLKKGDA